jgi:hypothetical protein
MKKKNTEENVVLIVIEIPKRTDLTYSDMYL